jgi:hypothetical protein
MRLNVTWLFTLQLAILIRNKNKASTKNVDSQVNSYFTMQTWKQKLFFSNGK